MKIYNPQSGSISSSIGAWVNYNGASKEAFNATRSKVFEDFPNSVIVDGTDDWFAPKHRRPETFIDLGIKLLAYYHSGISGISKSGIIISHDEFKKLETIYQKKYQNINLHKACKIYFSPTKQLNIFE